MNITFLLTSQLATTGHTLWLAYILNKPNLKITEKIGLHLAPKSTCPKIITAIVSLPCLHPQKPEGDFSCPNQTDTSAQILPAQPALSPICLHSFLVTGEGKLQRDPSQHFHFHSLSSTYGHLPHTQFQVIILTASIKVA